MKINMIIDGDYLNSKFAPLAVKLERDGHIAEILLTAKQTNFALEYNDPFKPILGLKDVLNASGFDIYQTIEILQDDDPVARLEFENKFNGITEETFLPGDTSPIEIIFVNSEDPDNGNIKLLAEGGMEFEIAGFPSSPSETAESLRIIFNQK